MHLDLTPEAVLKQLGYAVTKQNISQIETILKETEGLERFLPHLPSFIDALRPLKGYVAMSNSYPKLKIKCDPETSTENKAAFCDLVQHWAKKYKLVLQKVNETTYYINGHA